MQNFQNKVAVITGGASGLGFATATALAKHGARLVLADIEATALDKAVASFTSQGTQAIGVITDVSTRDAVAKENPALRPGLMLASPDFMYK